MIMKRFVSAMLLSSVAVGCEQRAASTAEGANGAVAETAAYPGAEILTHAAEDAGDWILPAKSYSSNRVTTLGDITPDNVTHLKKAWVTKLADDGQQEAAPIVWHGVMYLSTPHNHILALDASSGALKWENPYTAQYTILYFVNRGVGFADGKVFEATQDCHLIAADAATGKTLWNVRGCVDTTNSLYSMAAYPYDGKVLVANGGGDNGTRGHVQAFNAADGSGAWDWETLKHDTWPGNSWEHGGGAVWSGISVDPETHTLFLPVGNPGPDLILAGREGPDLYTNSIVALDVSTGTPRVKWYSQLLQNDTHDVDPSMAPVLFTGRVDGRDRAMVAIGNKGGALFMFDRGSGQLIHKVVVDDDYNLFTSVPTPQGTVACPNHGGGIEFNGVSYDSATNLIVIPSTDECGDWKTTAATATYVPGRAYTGGSLPTRRDGTGVLTAVDVATGRVAWRDSVGFPAQGGVTLTTTGLAFTSDLSGRVYAFDIRTGRELWRDSTGSSIVAPISIYRANGHVYVAVVSGEAGAQTTPNLPPPNGSVVTAYALDATGPVMNSADNQVESTQQPQAPGEGTPSSTGSAPYTPAQVQTGKAVFATQCASCHGAQLQGISAPGLTGPGFGRGSINLSALRTIITQTMPATAPGSLAPDQYAAVIAYLLAYDCVTPSGNGAVPFPTTDQPALKTVTIGGRSCPVK
jgi:alcohol dehydrogenase (cytochrome c)